jgi:hypothetical protein
LTEIKLNQHHLKAAIANNALSGSEVTDDMIKKLKKGLNDNPEIPKKELVAFLLKENRCEVKISSNIEDKDKNFITLQEARKRITPKAKRD